MICPTIANLGNPASSQKVNATLANTLCRTIAAPARLGNASVKETTLGLHANAGCGDELSGCWWRLEKQLLALELYAERLAKTCGSWKELKCVLRPGSRMPVNVVGRTDCKARSHSTILFPSEHISLRQSNTQHHLQIWANEH